MININKQARQVGRFYLVSGYMQKLPDGEYVFHSDYQALLDELDGAEKRIAELEAREVKMPDVEKWRSPEAVRAQNAYRVLVGRELSAAGITTKVGD